ncbi:protein of unknown function [Methanoculleus bourgensis]|uniref:Uncharacterized protein n=1 Tax=Methanoculleus bourgensis TaxID=83986 RepID=A0A0X3BHP3_9EURY|nr:protein of unknown function [Methanoculleus bourgensis]
MSIWPGGRSPGRGSGSSGSGDGASASCHFIFEDFDAQGGMPIATYGDGESTTTSREAAKVAKVTLDFRV